MSRRRPSLLVVGIVALLTLGRTSSVRAEGKLLGGLLKKHQAPAAPKCLDCGPPSTIAPPAAAEPAPTSPETPPAAPETPSNVDLDAVGDLEVASGPTSLAPNMIGDYFGSAGYVTANDSQQYVPVAGTPVGRRVKISENNRPIPTDRVFFNYNFFASPLNTLTPGPGDPVFKGVNVHRYTFGLEKTFASGMFSAEVRIPLSTTLDDRLNVDQNLGATANEFGNVNVTLKSLVYQSRTLAVAAGLGVNTPTGGDLRVFYADDILSSEVRNQAVHVMPYFAVLAAPSRRAFGQLAMQLDVDTNGNRYTNYEIPGLTAVIRDQTLLYLDVAAGYWLYLNPDARVVTGFAPIVETHYSTALENQAESSTDLYFNPFNRFDQVNLTLGSNLSLANRLTVLTGFVIPLTSKDQFQGAPVVGGNRGFDFEFVCALNWQFGGATPFTRPLY